MLTFIEPRQLMVMQLLRSDFYLDKIPQVLPFLRTRYGAARKKLHDMLLSEPRDADEELIMVWRKLQPMSLDLLA